MVAAETADSLVRTPMCYGIIFNNQYVKELAVLNSMDGQHKDGGESVN
jgi:hypothetical protein